MILFKNIQWHEIKKHSLPQIRPLRELKGLFEFCRAYVVTKSLDDFGLVDNLPETCARVLRIPAPLLCYWMGESELSA